MSKQEETLQEIILQPLAPTKSNVSMQAQRIASLVKDGHVDPLQAVIRLKALGDMIKEAKESIEIDVKMALSAYKDGKAELEGCKVNAKETGVRYDYSASPEWQELDEKIKELTAQREVIQEAMKRIPAGKVLVDEETGLTLQGATKSSTSSYEVRLGK